MWIVRKHIYTMNNMYSLKVGASSTPEMVAGPGVAFASHTLYIQLHNYLLSLEKKTHNNH